MGDDYWTIHKNNYHFQNSLEVASLLNKIISVCASNMPLKDILADISLQELIINIVQLQNRATLDNPILTHSNNHPLSYITGFIQSHITEDIKLEVLSEKACMSKSTFYRSFKREYGISPLEYILSEKIKMAKILLSDRNISIKSVSIDCGFNDVNYFIRLFKKVEEITPRQYQLLVASNGIIH